MASKQVLTKTESKHDMSVNSLVTNESNCLAQWDVLSKWVRHFSWILSFSGISCHCTLVYALYSLGHKHDTVLFWKNGDPENIVGLVQKVALASIASSCFLLVTLNHLQKNQGWQRGHKGDLFSDPEWYFILFSWNFDNINRAKFRKRRERRKKNPSAFG